MRDNPLKARLAAGGTVLGTMIFELLSPGLPTILRNAGADFVYYDMEHSGFSMAEIKNQLALCRGLDLVPIVRPPGKAYESAARLLDLGAMGLLFQMVESAEEAQRLVSWTRYPPQGVRGAIFGGAHDDYSAAPIPETMAAAHARTMVCVIIETERGLANVAEIAAVPGIDLLQFGHADLSLSLGIPGEFEHPALLAGVDRLLTACEQHGKTAGCLVGSIEQGRRWLARGFRLVAYQYDIVLLGGALAAGLGALREPGAG